MTDKLTPEDIDRFDRAVEEFGSDMRFFDEIVNRFKRSVEHIETVMAAFEDTVKDIPVSIELEIPEKKD